MEAVSEITPDLVRHLASLSRIGLTGITCSSDQRCEIQQNVENDERHFSKAICHRINVNPS